MPFQSLPADEKNIKFCLARTILSHPDAAALEDWISTKDYTNGEPVMPPKWHIPSDDEVKFANELLDLHLQSALDDLYRICQARIRSGPGD